MSGSAEFPKTYDAAGVEQKRYAWWEENGFFAPRPPGDGAPYTLMMPPPNVTGILHMGHAFNITYQDILARWRRMSGRRTLWLPGSDHAGIATQNVVERALAKEGVTRRALGRDAFIERIWAWKEEHGGTISRQLRRLGASCDWSRERFTMDAGLCLAVRHAFVHLFRKGLIYRGKYLINWCPRCTTALSDEEVEHRDVHGHLYSIRYLLKGGAGEVVIATTRPETMLGDTAVAVNPADERYCGLTGATVILPIVGREIPVIEDPQVDTEMGTGALKVTPAHDPVDFELGERHGLERVNILNPDGTLNENAGPFEGLDVPEARRRVLDRLKADGLLVGTEPHDHPVGHCYRCGTVVEPYVSSQWFVRMKPLAEPALQAVLDGTITFHPARWTKIYVDWMEKIRDWCISRQIWWGHRIPVWTCEACGGQTVEIEDPERCGECGGGPLRQDEDVLDTWFSSWLWPFSTLGWPGRTEDLAAFYPTDTLVTAHEIIFFWVARMIMSGIEFMGGVPFRDVYIHGTIRDDTGRKMSKSLGNTIDPLDVIGEFGADALRFSLIGIASEGQDVYLAPEKFHIGRNLTNKIWNAARFLTMNLREGFTPGPAPDGGSTPLADRWILSRYHATIRAVTASLEGFRFNEAASALYEFFWHDYCDAYIELVKDRWVEGGDAEDADRARRCAWLVLEGVLRLFHPFIPFISEEIWQRIPHEGETVMRAAWPEVDEASIDPAAESEMASLREIVRSCLMLKGDYGLAVARAVAGHFVDADRGRRESLERHAGYISRLAGISPVRVHADFEPPRQTARTVSGTTGVCIPLAGLIDTDRESARLSKEIDRLRAQVAGIDRRLANPDFLGKAPAEVVERERSKREDFTARLTRLKRNLRTLQGGE